MSIFPRENEEWGIHKLLQMIHKNPAETSDTKEFS